MPRDRYQRPDSYANIRSWDDGYEYIKPQSDDVWGDGPSPTVNPPPQPSRTSRPSRYGPAGLPKPPLAGPKDPHTAAWPHSPSSDSYTRTRRSRQERSPPPPMGSTHTGTPPRHRGERSLKDSDARYTVGSGNTRHGRSNRPRTDPFEPTKSSRQSASSRSPSPPLGRRPCSPTPSRHGGTRTRFLGRDEDRDRRPPASYRPPSPSSPVGYRPSRRPYIQRSKTTSAREHKVDDDRDGDWSLDRDGQRSTHRNEPSSSTEGMKRPYPVSRAVAAGGAKPSMQRSKTSSIKDKGLSPRWQKAALAALQAGGIAAMNARSQPGAWKGEKGARVATAALGAAALDAFNKAGRDTTVLGEGKTRRGDDVENLGGAIGGMLAERLTTRKSTGSHGNMHKDMDIDRDRDRR
ncbi:hypothetical protein CONLIGDRAFT_681869 [Coniochaeta ligniaria NRRL 30616]|uniref:Uncharacterized protein n=1 Tax=Coniochaeta ligniaria NRRL 30616 TaxID=1408157 RepID=A0A1J7IP23_9PEZI|nr:hypothetical protein CONLIGDRAFT_681869 [Coniochaeta ligniaria NRRL 30616]